MDILRPAAAAEKASSARLATDGFAAGMKPQFVPKMVLNIFAPEQVIPAVQGSLVAESIKHVIVQQIMRGTGAAVLFPVHPLINIVVQEPAMPVAQALPAVENIRNVRVQADMSGRTEVVSSRF